MTESMGYLHEFETQRPKQQDTIGIEIEFPPTIDMIKQKRAATTTRSIKIRQRSNKHHNQNDDIGKRKFFMNYSNHLYIYINSLDRSKLLCL